MPEQDFNRKTASAAKFKRKREAAEAARTKPCTSSSGGTQRLPVAVAPCARDDPVRRHNKIGRENSQSRFTTHQSEASQPV